MRTSDSENEQAAGGIPEGKDQFHKMPAKPLARVSFLQLNCMLCLNLVNGMLLASYMLLVLPVESQRINQASRSIVLGCLMGMAGVTQLISPLAGLLSDRCASRWGRRRPMILPSAIVGILGILAQECSSAYHSPWLYCIAFTISMIGLNVAYTASVGITPDMVPPEQTGTATGVAALHTVVGANLGFLVWLTARGDSEHHLHTMYRAYMMISVVCLVLVMLSVKEAAQLVCSPPGQADGPAPAAVGCWLTRPLTWQDMVSSYYIDPRKHVDFTLVFWSRTLYYFGVSVQTFLKYYLRDILGVEDSEGAIVKAAIVGQLFGAVTALPVGLLSDHIGKMRKPFIYCSCVVLAVGTVANCFARSMTDILVIAGCLGAANGVYLTMDAALALDFLPSGKEAARFLGVWGIGCFIGAAAGPLLVGPLLAIFGHDRTKHEAYSYGGYVIVLCLAAVCFLLSGVVLRGVGRGAAPEESAALAEGSRAYDACEPSPPPASSSA